MKRALVVCPGRGSYGRDTLGILQDRRGPAAEVIAACDSWRAERGLPTVSELDADERFSGRRHVAGEHASLLTFAASMADLRDLSDRFEIVGVAGNSMGFYTALAASGALPLADAIRLVDTMGVMQQGNVIGGQVMYPLTGPDWQPDPALRAAVDEALATAERAWWSIDLGSVAVLGGDAPSIKWLLQALPPVERGARTFPVQLPMHSAFHTPLMQETSERARRELADLRFRAPRVPLVDGAGTVYRPRWASPDALFDYTLGTQVVAPYDFAASLRTALHHTAPDVVVALGPGNALGGPIAAGLVAAGWRGIRTRGALLEADEPLLLSFGVPEQREQLT